MWRVLLPAQFDNSSRTPQQLPIRDLRLTISTLCTSFLWHILLLKLSFRLRY